MQVIFHLGAHCTGEDRLLKSLLKNRETLIPQGVIVPRPSRYRRLIRQTLGALNGAGPSADEQRAMLVQITDELVVKRLVLSAADFLAFVPWVFRHKTLYGKAPEVITALRNLFPDANVEFHLSIRNPATFIPAVFGNTTGLTLDKFLYETDPHSIRWSGLINNICTASPGTRVVVWRYEDCPLIWSRVMRNLTGMAEAIPLKGEEDILSSKMTVEGLKLYQNYLAANPPKSGRHKQRIINTFLEKFPQSPSSPFDDIPDGWSKAMVEELTDLYEQDLEKVSNIPAVKLITP